MKRKEPEPCGSVKKVSMALEAIAAQDAPEAPEEPADGAGGVLGAGGGAGAAAPTVGPRWTKADLVRVFQKHEGVKVKTTGLTPKMQMGLLR